MNISTAVQVAVTSPLPSLAPSWSKFAVDDDKKTLKLQEIGCSFAESPPMAAAKAH